MGILRTDDPATTWSLWREASCMPDRCFCESVGNGVVRQPANSLSSGAFVMVALVALWQSRAGVAGVGVDRRVAARFAFAVAVVGVGSAFFHASLTFWGQTVDVLGMYLLATFLLLESLARRARWSATQQQLYFWGGNVVLLLALIGVPGARRYVFGAIVAAILWSEWQHRRSRVADSTSRSLVPAVGVLAVGFAVWIADLTRVLCVPESLWQDHAFWHLCGALSAWLAYHALAPRTAPRPTPRRAPAMTPPHPRDDV